MNLAYRIFSGKEKDVFEPLLDDESIRNKIIRKASAEMARTKEFLIRKPYEQILCIMMNADFADEEEHVFLAGSVKRYIKEPNLLPMITKHKGLDLASRCLISLGLFRKNMEERSKRYGAPKPDFYERVGVETFRKEYMFELAGNFTNWEKYLNANFSRN